jgi:hypothetical protein
MGYMMYSEPEINVMHGDLRLYFPNYTQKPPCTRHPAHAIVDEKVCSRRTTMLPASVHRVPRSTSDRVNQEIRKQTAENLAYFATATPEAIDRRIEELNHEWDIERALETNAAALALIGLGLSVLVSRKWLILPTIVASFLFQHGLQGWCPPVPVLRRLGFRTPHEIDREKYALKVLRGDFKQVPEEPGMHTGRLLEAAEF